MIEFNSYIDSKFYSIEFAIVILLFILMGYFLLIRFNFQLKKDLAQLNQINDFNQVTLATKETQLKEIHHRIKNNLQLIVSLLNIEAKNNNNSVEDFLFKVQTRIHSIALIHQNLYETEFTNSVDLQYYLESIVHNLSQIYKNDVEIEINTNNTILDVETAIPIGLIITELVCNSFKHAFYKNNAGKIKIDIINKKLKKYELTLQDNGIGFPEIPSPKNAIGLDLVSIMVLQINGEINRKNNQGAFYNISF
ncbi:MAG: sensor histidine kinase [Flavobacterium sp.]|jgi:two-component sensor histidine kinase|nr:sensor histidine kinase [Flavobacterium sp.]